MNINNDLILEKTKEIIEYAKEVQGYLHENPEVSGKEYNTSNFLQNEVNKLGLFVEKVSNTGFIVTMECGQAGKTIALRADIDALPMSESSYNLKGRKKYVSKNPNACHSCGHDAHMAILLATMKVLNQIKDELKGTIIFLFEEGEERGLGINPMMNAISNRKIDGVFGIHVVSFLEAGKINVQPGQRMAGVAPIKVRVIGRGGHASTPHLSINPLFGAAQVITALSSAWVNRINPEEPVTLGLANIHGGTAANIFPEYVDIGGSLRFFGIEEGEKALKIVKEVSKSAAESQGCTVEFEGMDRVVLKPVINDERFSNFIKNSIEDVLPDNSLVDTDKWYASETFSHYSKYPSVFAFLGIKNERLGSGAEHHNEKFDIDQNSLKVGIVSSVKLVVDFLSN